MDIIGRESELRIIDKLTKSNNPEMLMVTGRRRVGKTYLINYAFNNKFSFKFTGISPDLLEGDDKSKNKEQLKQFYYSLKKYGYQENIIPNDWFNAFYILEQLIDSKSIGDKQVIFLDELPWLDIPGSQFLGAFSNFVNDYALARDNVLLITCGSSISWMEKVFVDNKGSLYRRATKEIRLMPFSLKETEELLTKSGFALTRYEITKIYMILGGIPFYLKQLDKDLTVSENIDNLFFNESSVLKDEFVHLFKAIFNHSEIVEKIVRLLSKKRIGFSKKEIVQTIGISDNGKLTEILNSLLSSKIVMRYVPFNGYKNDRYYKLIDPFILFYLRFVDGNATIDPTFYQDNMLSQAVISFQGFSFENICFYHIDKIKEALGIRGVVSDISTFREAGTKTTKGGQIDLLIIRKDNVIDDCEIKFYNSTYTLSKDEYDSIKDRESLLAMRLKKRFAIHHIIITSIGVKKNEYSNTLYKVITLDDLF